MSNEIEDARNTMREAFEKDPNFYLTYQSNVAMLLYDRYGIKDVGKRNSAADEILKLVFWD